MPYAPTSVQRLKQIRKEWPEVVVLAEPLALAVRIEPELLRDVRLALLPASHASLEADLYFSPLISQRTPEWMSVDPPLAHELQKKLAAGIRRGGKDEEGVRRVRAMVERAHFAVPFEIAREEQVIWMSVEQAGGKAKARRAVNEVLQDLLMRMLQGTDASVALARWFAGAAKRIPSLARETESFALLAFASSSILGGRKIEAKVSATLDTFEALARYLPPSAKRVTVWGALTTRGLHLRPEQYAGYQSVEIPLTNPVLLEARPENGKPILVQFSPGQTAFVPLPPGMIALRTLTRDLLTFHPRAATAAHVEPVRSEHTPKEGLQRLAPSEARQLLTSIVPRLRLPLAIADKIAQLCGYLPLALRASGSLLDVTADLDPANYAAQLADERMRLERIGTETVEVGVEASVNLSYAHLSSEAQRVFAQLSVFPASFNPLAEEAVCEDAGHVHLSDLLRHSLVLYDSQTGRYRLHDLVRLFAALRLKSDDAGRRHRDWYLKFAEERAPVLREGAGEERALKEIELEYDNLRSALDWSTAKSEWGSALRLCAALWRFWEIRRLSEGRKDLKQLIDTVEKLGPEFVTAETPETVAALGEVYSAGGILAYRQGDRGEAMVLFKRAFEIEQKRGDPKRIANCLNDLGLAAYATGNLQGALQYYKDYLEVAREIDAKREIAVGLFNVGQTEMRLGHFEEARSPLEESRKRFEELHHSDIAYPLTTLGWLAVFDNDAAKAEALFAESSKRREQVKHKRGMVDSWNGLARAAILRDDFEETRRRLTEGLTLARELGADEATAQIIESFAILAVRENEMVKALTLSSAAKALRENIQSPRTPAFAKDQEQWMEKAKGVLGADKSAGAIAAGLAMKLDDIINLTCPNPSSL